MVSIPPFGVDTVSPFYSLSMEASGKFKARTHSFLGLSNAPACDTDSGTEQETKLLPLFWGVGQPHRPCPRPPDPAAQPRLPQGCPGQPPPALSIFWLLLLGEGATPAAHPGSQPDRVGSGSLTEEGVGSLAGDPACVPCGMKMQLPSLIAGERHNQLPTQPGPRAPGRGHQRVINQPQRFPTCFSSYTPQG